MLEEGAKHPFYNIWNIIKNNKILSNHTYTYIFKPGDIPGLLPV